MFVTTALDTVYYNRAKLTFQSVLSGKLCNNPVVIPHLIPGSTMGTVPHLCCIKTGSAALTLNSFDGKINVNWFSDIPAKLYTNGFFFGGYAAAVIV